MGYLGVLKGHLKVFCEAQARVRQGLAGDGHQKAPRMPKNFNPCQELTLKLVATFPPTHPQVSLQLTNGQVVVR